MNIAAQIRQTIGTMPEDKIFGYADLGISRDVYLTSAKALERLQKEGLIRKMSKGIFYKPKMTVFGELKPDDREQLKPYLFKNGKRIAYVTGESLYNEMGLTTQMAFRIKIAGNRRINIDKGALKAKSVKSYTNVTDENYLLLGFLDAIKDIKKIPDCSAATAVIIIMQKLKKFDDKEIKQLTNYALLYPPRVRALLGAMLEKNKKTKILSTLKKSLNPMTTFKLRLNERDLPTMKNWYIV
jgi:hypothetical protein